MFPMPQQGSGEVETIRQPVVFCLSLPRQFSFHLCKPSPCRLILFFPMIYGMHYLGFFFFLNPHILTHPDSVLDSA